MAGAAITPHVTPLLWRQETQPELISIPGEFAVVANWSLFEQTRTNARGPSIVYVLFFVSFFLPVFASTPPLQWSP
jgi:hypothetical protein